MALALLQTPGLTSNPRPEPNLTQLALLLTLGLTPNPRPELLTLTLRSWMYR